MKHIIKKLIYDTKPYQPIPFWSWNDKLEECELERQMKWMQRSGIGGFFMHARAGLKTEYLSDEWMKAIEFCCKEAQTLNMDAWVYDENGWPSGFAGGKLLADESNRDWYILSGIGAYDLKADVSYQIDDNVLQRAEQGDETKLYLNLYFHKSTSTVDILNPKVVEKFLNITHNAYKRHFGEEFSKMLKGFFTDEPQYYRWKTPYTPMISQYFKEEYQEDILDNLGLLFIEKEGYRTFRYRYWLGMQRLMLQNYAEKVYNWCESNGVKLTGHYIEETTLGTQIMCCGGVMPFYEYEHIPGIDWLGAGTCNELPIRQVGSVARQLGKKQVLTETFGCCGWDISPLDLQRIAGFQYVNGANVTCHHLVPYSERGQRKRDYPAHFSLINPWIDEHFKGFNNYFSRLGMLLGEGEERVNVAMLHPIRSAYFDYKREEENNAFGIAELETALQSACRNLSSRGIEYHFLDETILEKYGNIDEDKFVCANCSYKFLVLPKIYTMGKHTEKLIRKFVDNGGRILLLDESPTYLEGEPYEYVYLQSNITLEDIEKEQPFQVVNREANLYYTYRKLDKQEFVYIQNASADTTYEQTLIIPKRYSSFVALDLNNLQMKQSDMTITVPANEGILLFFSKDEIILDGELEEVDLKFTDAEVNFDTNFLTVDVVCYSKNGVDFSEPILCNQLFGQLLEERYQGKLWLKYPFEIQVKPKQMAVIAEDVSVERRVNGHNIIPIDKCQTEPSFWYSDITDYVREGNNSYEIVLDWYQSEETYYALFGENVTESLKNCISYDSEIEAIRLVGKFGVYSKEEFENFDEETVCGCDFYVGGIPEKVSEPIKDGFPFFRGKLTMRQKFYFSDTNVKINVHGRYLNAKVWVNGTEAGSLLYERQLDISKWVCNGENEIEIQFNIGNRNFMGPFHCSWPEVFVGPGLFKLCNLPNSKEGKIRYRLYRFYKENVK